MRAPVYPIDAAPARLPARPHPRTFALPASAKAALVLLLGMGLGLYTTAWMLDHKADIAARNVGPWTLWPKSGTSDIDPYARAIYAQSGQIPLASAEGVLVWANADQDGDALTGRCRYQISGELPTARFWTLSAATPAGAPIDNPAWRYGFTSAEVLRRSDGSFLINAASSVRPGNWLPVASEERFVLLLRLYDPASGNSLAGLASAGLPSIRREVCR